MELSVHGCAQGVAKVEGQNVVVVLKKAKDTEWGGLLHCNAIVVFSGALLVSPAG